ncbi:MAG: 4'-phosphopantetheinyl transferase family protein [Hyphomonas sp.]
MSLPDFFFPFRLPSGVLLAVRAHAGAVDGPQSLSECELLRVTRLKDPARQEDLRRSFAVRRQAVADLTGVTAREIELSWSEEGAPLLSAPDGWNVSVSTVDGWTAIALAPAGTPLGVDISRIKEVGWGPMLQMVSVPDEAAAFADRYSGDAGLALRAFHRLWAIKEATLKATGRGMRAGAKNVPVVMDWLAAPSAAFSLTAFGQRFTGVAGEAEGLAACVIAGLDQR